MKTQIVAALMLALSTLSANSAQATDFCVDSTPQMVNALASAAANGVNDRIRVRSVSIVAAAGGFVYQAGANDVNRSLEISGGWNLNCTVQTQNSNLSTLTGVGSSRILRISRGVGSTGEVRISRLHFSDGFSASALSFDSTGVALQLISNQHTGESIVENCLFTDNVMLNSLYSVYILHRGSLIFRNNVVARNEAGIGAPGASIQTITNSSAVIVNNTFTANSAVGFGEAGMGLVAYTSGTAFQIISNNIIWGNNSGNQPADLSLGEAVTLFSNDIGGIVAPANTTLIGNVNVDPQFLGANDFRLGGASAARDIGENTPFGGLAAQDLDGAARIRNSVVDLGAYEAAPELMFRNGFE